MMTIAIDAGHGTLDPNTGQPVTPGKRVRVGLKTGCGIVPVKEGGEWRNYFIEGIWNRICAEHLSAALRDVGFITVRVFHDWRDTSRLRRATIANMAKADLLLSLHANAGGGEGFEAFYNNERARQVGEAIAEALQYMGLCPLRRPAVKPNLYGFGILKYPNCPALILEAGFYDNPKDLERLINEAWVADYAQAITVALTGLFT